MLPVTNRTIISLTWKRYVLIFLTPNWHVKKILKWSYTTLLRRLKTMPLNILCSFCASHLQAFRRPYIVPWIVGALCCGTSLVQTRWLQATSTELSWVWALWLPTRSRNTAACLHCTTSRRLPWRLLEPSANRRWTSSGSYDAALKQRLLRRAHLHFWRSVSQRCYTQRGNAVCFAGTAPSSGDLNMDI